MQLTGLARSTIYNLTSEGKIPYMKRLNLNKISNDQLESDFKIF
ncbi:helix-turn-helix transcriptional regulator [Xanthocytophaga flava]